MKRLSLIYASSCPNYKPIRQMLEGSSGKNFSSPTLLKDNDIIIFGGKTNSSEGACTTNLPDKEELRNIINGLT